VSHLHTLFKGPRPEIATAPGVLDHGQTFSLTSPSATDISSISLIKPGSVTRSASFDQRFLDLEFTRNGQTLSVDAPATAASPPGGLHDVSHQLGGRSFGRQVDSRRMTGRLRVGEPRCAPRLQGPSPYNELRIPKWVLRPPARVLNGARIRAPVFWE
jgi:hypothetical protein